MKKQSILLALGIITFSASAVPVAVAATYTPKDNGNNFSGQTGNIIQVKNFKDAQEADLMEAILPGDQEYAGANSFLDKKDLREKQNPVKENEEWFTLTCILEAEYEQPFFAVYNEDFYSQSNPIGWMESESFDTYKFQVPAGVFDVNVQFSVYNGNSIYNAFIVHENVEITEDTIIYFSPEELTEQMVFQPKLRNGELASLPYKASGQDPDYSNSNITYAGLGCLVEKIGGKILATSLGQSTLTYDEYTGITFLCNQISDSYRFLTHFVLVTTDGELQISTTDHRGSTNGFINNYIQDFKQYECPQFVETPIYNNDSGVPTSLQSLVWMDDTFRCGYILKLRTSNPTVYATCEPVDWNLKPALQVSSIQDPETVSFFDSKEIVALPAIQRESNWEYINSDPLGFSNPYPGFPQYCYPASQLTQPLGNNAPIMTMYTQTWENNGRESYLFSMPEYIGRYGEKRKCDTAVITAEAYLNGVRIYNSETDGSFRNWINDNANNDREEPGNLEVLITDNNIMVDDVQGCNFSLIRVNETSADKCPPALRMLIFKDQNGNITDRFNNAQEGVFEFSAGDFNWIDDGYQYGIQCEEIENMIVAYAPYGADGENDMELLDFELDLEDSTMPSFGYLYRGSLSGVTKNSPNGWYDLYFIFSDVAGNEMVQQISPAFKISDSESGLVPTTVNTKAKIKVRDGMAYIETPECDMTQLYSVDGKLIASSNSDKLPTNGLRGLAIIKITDKNGNITTLKTIIP